jgi:hypothetical protein
MGGRVRGAVPLAVCPFVSALAAPPPPLGLVMPAAAGGGGGGLFVTAISASGAVVGTRVVMDSLVVVNNAVIAQNGSAADDSAFVSGGGLYLSIQPGCETCGQNTSISIAESLFSRNSAGRVPLSAPPGCPACPCIPGTPGALTISPHPHHSLHQPHPGACATREVGGDGGKCPRVTIAVATSHRHVVV